MKKLTYIAVQFVNIQHFYNIMHLLGLTILNYKKKGLKYIHTLT